MVSRIYHKSKLYGFEFCPQHRTKVEILMYDMMKLWILISPLVPNYPKMENKYSQ